jgi:antitoxin FitA
MPPHRAATKQGPPNFHQVASFCSGLHSLLSLLHKLRHRKGSMATLTIRNFDDALKEQLRIRAAERGHSIEAEARRILQLALAENRRPSERNLYERIHDRFAALGGVDLELPPREPVREPPRFD